MKKSMRTQLQTLICNEHGYSTIYFSLMIVIFVSVFTLCMGALIRINKVNEQMRQASLMSRIVLSHYDNALENRYGLLAYSQKSVDCSKIFSSYFEKDWKVTPIQSMASLASFQDQSIALGKLTLVEKGFEAAQQMAAPQQAVPTPQQKSEMDQRIREKQAANSQLGQSSSGNEELEDVDLSETDKERARRLKQKMLNGSKPNWTIENGGEIPMEIYQHRFKFETSSAKNLSLTERGLVTAYLMSHFNQYVQWQKTPEKRPTQSGIWFEGGEIEYILEGSPKSTQNQLWVNGKIFAMREGVNLLYLAKSEEKLRTTAALASLICAVFPMGEPLVQAGLIGLWASIESGYDLNQLMAGESIPLFKLTSADWKTDLETEAAEAPTKEQPKDINAIDYEGYLTLMLMAQSDQVTALRTMTLIDLNFKKSGKSVEDWGDLIVAHQIWVRGLTGKETTFEDGYLLTKKSEGQPEH